MNWRHYLRNAHKICPYTAQSLEEKRRTIEHVIPSRLLTMRQKSYHYNLFIISADLNLFRRDYRFGMIRDGMEMHMSSGARRCPIRRVFAPTYGHRLIAQSVIDTIEQYPELWQYREHFLEDVHLLDKWSQQSWHPHEKMIYDIMKNTDRSKKKKI